MYQDELVPASRFGPQPPHHELHGSLREALDGDGFVLYGQPIVDLLTGETLKHELTLRLPAGEGRLIAPAGFHPLAERFDLMPELDDLLIRWAAGLAGRGRAVAVDVHASALADCDLARRTEQTIAAAGAAPQLMTFELSEPSLALHAPAASAFVQRMHDLGCSVTADAFGATPAGFGYLTRLPLDWLKIDACFVERLPTTSSDQQFVWAFARLAQGLGIGTAADGVNDAPTRDVLRDAGVEQGQGALFGPPAPVPSRALASLSPLRGARSER